MMSNFQLLLIGVSEALIEGFSIATYEIWSNIFWLFLGATVGLMFGLIPGLGGSIALALLIPVTIFLPPTPTFILLGAALGGTTFGGSVTAILLNVPGTSSNAATLIDGFPLAQQGEGIKAIGVSAYASALGAIIGISIFLITLPILMDIVLLFGPTETIWIIATAFIVVPTLVADQVKLGLAAAFLGVYIGLMGRHPVTHEFRFNFGVPALTEGIGIIPVVIGFFALTEMFRLGASEPEIIAKGEQLPILKSLRESFLTIKIVLEHKYLFIRCSLIGTAVGIIPGVGGSASTFIAYAHAVQSSPDPSSFGTGRIEGVLGSEAANDAKDGGQLFPALGLGIPGSGSTAVLLGAFIANGIVPSPRLLIDHLEVMLIVTLSLLLANIWVSLLGLCLTPLLEKVTRIPLTMVIPGIIVFSLTSTFLIRNNFLDVLIAVAIGFIGLYMVYLGIPRVPAVIAFILTPLLEQNIFLAMDINREPLLISMLSGWINIILFIILIASSILIVWSPRHLWTDGE